MIDKDNRRRAADVLRRAEALGWHVATAESCTGGLIAATLTEIAGSSAVVDRGFVTYSNEAKTAMLGVPAGLIGRVGAVSEEVARAMAEGARRQSGVELGVSCTGVAGPGGGTAAKPVGLVHLACSAAGQPTRHRKMLFGDLGRSGIRAATVTVALDMLIEAIEAAIAR
ncbi:CinA family protein [Oceanibacterium hippocampi]|uniref:Nicotinamide-nucleotide amidohydrolase PncC n=1 Tax=Oceanibacterium hippocampi TaxID=745714 RepID=A0A1Y5T2W6_9PROT|nr:nicotinamide-nucleotide amidohydrolase family protein [Oceanibacterium hippocampi]SLN54621.1 Nicotinamide-nucleotide amidohydrolase PncC [Oceanibacterium hippocampi]